MILFSTASKWIASTPPATQVVPIRPPKSACDELDPDGLPDIQAGAHVVPEAGACLMEYVSVLAGSPFGAHPRCTAPPLAPVAPPGSGGRGLQSPRPPDPADPCPSSPAMSDRDRP